MDSVDVYVEMEIEAKRKLMGKVIPLKEKERKGKSK
jgi:hypothetical protein